MSANHPFLEVVRSDSIASDYLAVIVLEQPQEELMRQLSFLHPHGNYTIAVVERYQPDAPKSFLKKSKEANKPLLFLQPQAPSFSQITKGRTSFSVNIISPGSALDTDLAAQCIAHPKTTNLSWIGYQTYLTPPQNLNRLQERHFAPLRLGSFRERSTAAEPLIRHNDLSLIDMTAVRYSDAPDGCSQNPNGLYAEELCQLARYIGVSSHPQACFIYGYNSSKITTTLLAQVLWHLFESLSTGQNEDPYCPKQQMVFTPKEVYIGSQDHILHFLYSDQTERWWIKLLLEDNIAHFFPCDYEEYAAAVKGELPATWLRYYQKLNLL